METFRDRANPLQGTAQQRAQISPQSRLRQSRALERGFVVARNDPGFVGDARGVRSERDVVSASFDYARGLALLLSENVTEDTTLFRLEILASRTQLVKHTARHEHGGRNLRGRVTEFLAGIWTVIL